jgi:DNA-binding CsgD family transcriptional regulator
MEPTCHHGSPAVHDNIAALTEREKETLRLLLQGYDAKSIARRLDLSVHTINERLRDARRKLALSSSREAARLLTEAERATPQPVGDEILG